MPGDPTSLLTALQKEALRLVYEGFTSDEIARRVGASTAAVDDRILVARRKLGGVTRAAAARMLIQAENLPLPYNLGRDPQPFGLHPTAVDGDAGSAVDVDGEVRETGSPFALPPVRLQPFWNRPFGRLVVGIGGTLMLLIVLALLRPVGEGFSWLADAVSPPFEWRGERGNISTKRIPGSRSEHGPSYRDR